MSPDMVDFGDDYRSSRNLKTMRWNYSLVRAQPDLALRAA